MVTHDTIAKILLARVGGRIAITLGDVNRAVRQRIRVSAGNEGIEAGSILLIFTLTDKDDMPPCPPATDRQEPDPTGGTS